MKINIGIIGIGDFGTLHIETLLQNHEVSILSICSRNETKLKEYCQKYNIPKYYLNVDKMLNDVELDGVIIATSEDSHYKFTEKAIQKNKHVLLEKPICLTKEEAEQFSKLDKLNNNYILPGHILRYDSSYNNLKTILEDKNTGEVQSIRVKRNVPIERFSLHSRTHPIFMALAHDIDIITWLTKSTVKKVYGIQKKTKEEFKNPDIVFGVVEMENGIICNLETQWRLPNEYGKYLDTEVEIMTSNGNIKLNSPGNNLSSMIKGKSQGYDVTLWPKVNDKYTGALVNEQNHFIDLVSGRETNPVVTISEAISGIEFCLMLIKSCDTGKVITKEDL